MHDPADREHHGDRDEPQPTNAAAFLLVGDRRRRCLRGGVTGDEARGSAGRCPGCRRCPRRARSRSSARSSSPGEVPVSSSSADRILPGTCSSIVDPSIRGGMNVFSAASGSSRIVVGRGRPPRRSRISRLIPRYGPNDSTGTSGSTQHHVDPERRPDDRPAPPAGDRTRRSTGPRCPSSTISARAEMRSGASVRGARAGTDAGTRTRVSRGIGSAQHERRAAGGPGPRRPASHERISSPARPG